MKRIIIALLSVVIALSVFSGCSSHDNGFETAQQTVSNITVGWNLGNTLDSNGEWIGLYSEGKPENYETAWGNPVTTPELMETVKAAGFNAVRVPVTWYEHIDENGEIDPMWIARCSGSG